jgi:hypothetical protein
MITLFIPYFGSFPNYFQLYLDSLGVNQDVLTVVLVTDIPTLDYRLPPNLHLVNMTFDALRERVATFLRNTFGKSPPASELIQSPYKLVDFKVTYPLLFAEHYDATNVDDFVGWGDIDLIYGSLAQFVKGNYDIIGGWHGHFTAIKNTDLFKNLFLTVPKFYDLVTDNSKTYITDEIAYREPLVAFIKQHNLKMCFLNASFTDVIPPCFFHLSRPDHAKYAKNYYSLYKPAKNINYMHRKANGHLETVFDDGEIQETSYLHMQKRKLTVNLPLGQTEYYIHEPGFTANKPEEPAVIPANLFMTWHTRDMSPKMQENVDRIGLRNPEFTIRIYDVSACVAFLEEHFPKDIIAAYHALKPLAYKADLWRLCVLYVYGGIYMDIKLRPTDTFQLKTLLTREHFVYDGPFKDSTGTHTQSSIYNGLMSCKAGNSILLKAIVAIVWNVSRGFYGASSFAITGPHLLASFYESATNKEPLYLMHCGPPDNQTIKRNNIHDVTLFTEYPEYRTEVARMTGYSSMWTNKQVYADVLPKIDTTTWTPAMVSILKDLQSVNKIRLHMPAIPYTITRDEHSHDAYTGKVQRFGPMMRSRPDFEVYHYGVETSEAGADKDITLMTKEEWHQLRIDSMMFVDPKLTRAEAEAKVLNPKTIVSTLANWSTPLFIEFNKRFKVALKDNYRSTATDIVCVPLGHSYDAALNGMNVTVVESGIGYGNSCKNYRIFESYSWMSRTIGVDNKPPNNYWFVVPNYYDTNEFRFTPVPPPSQRPRVGFLGRVISEKGCHVISEIAKRFPAVDFVLCGQGDATPFLQSPNITYKAPIHGAERSDYLGSCIATICASTYLEPFGGSNVESQLCGTPVISVDNGAFVETVEQFRTGLRCHTLADFCKGVQMALDGAFDRAYVRERAVRLYDMYNVAIQYEYAFKSILDIHKPGKNGWYSPDCHLIQVPPSMS